MYSMRYVNVNKLFNMDDAHLYVASKTSSLYIFDFYLLLQ